MQDHALAHASQVDAFLAVVLAIIEPLDGETIAERFDRITKGDAMIAPVAAALASSHSNSSACIMY